MAMGSAEIAKLILNDPRLDVENIAEPQTLFKSAINKNNSDSLDLLLSDNRIQVPTNWENYDVIVIQKIFSSFHSFNYPFNIAKFIFLHILLQYLSYSIKIKKSSKIKRFI